MEIDDAIHVIVGFILQFNSHPRFAFCLIEFFATSRHEYGRGFWLAGKKFIAQIKSQLNSFRITDTPRTFSDYTPKLLKSLFAPDLTRELYLANSTWLMHDDSSPYIIIVEMNSCRLMPQTRKPVDDKKREKNDTKKNRNSDGPVNQNS